MGRIWHRYGAGVDIMGMGWVGPISIPIPIPILAIPPHTHLFIFNTDTHIMVLRVLGR